LPVDVAGGELPAQDDTRPAAVLCLLFDDEGEACVVLTRRAAHLRAHAGEVSFPGGRLQIGETPLQAARREAHEEVGLAPAGVQVIGELTPLTTRRSTALVHCFVAQFAGPGPGGRDLRADRSEVDRIFWVPLSRLAEEGVFHEELWPLGTGAAAVPFFDLGDEVVWGATGRLLKELLSVVLADTDAGGPAKGTLVGQ
jgi:8-oxo-dGTP pyrophosphatase MutT (NUDIX family)